MNTSVAQLTTLANDLNHSETRVFLIMLAYLDYENLFSVRQSKLGEMLGMKQPLVSRSLKGLLDKGVLLEGEKDGQCKTYRLNPNYGWRGTAKNHKHALRVVKGGKA